MFQPVMLGTAVDPPITHNRELVEADPTFTATSPGNPVMTLLGVDPEK